MADPNAHPYAAEMDDDEVQAAWDSLCIGVLPFFDSIEPASHAGRLIVDVFQQASDSADPETGSSDPEGFQLTQYGRMAVIQMVNSVGMAQRERGILRSNPDFQDIVIGAQNSLQRVIDLAYPSQYGEKLGQLVSDMTFYLIGEDCHF